MRRNQTFSLWGFIISALILVIFAVQNATEVRFNFFVWDSHLSLSVLLIVAFLLGLIAGAIFSFRQSKAPKHEEPKSKKKISEEQNSKNDSPDKWDDLEDIDIHRDK